MPCSITAPIVETLGFHQHAPHELIVCNSDSGFLELDGHKFEYKTGRTFLIPGGVRHRVAGKPQAEAVTQFICFDDALADSLGILSLPQYLSNKYLRYSVCSREHAPSYRENVLLGRKLQSELDKPSHFSSILCKSILTQLLVNHCRLARIPTLVKTNSKTFQIEKICELIIRDPAQPVTVEQMAKLAGMSRSYFAQKFKEVTGKSLIEYVTMIRLQKSCQMLTHTTESATYIAYSCGFGNLGHFYNVFKKHHGMTPVDYRQWSLSQRAESSDLSRQQNELV